MLTIKKTEEGRQFESFSTRGRELFNFEEEFDEGMGEFSPYQRRRSTPQPNNNLPSIS